MSTVDDAPEQDFSLLDRVRELGVPVEVESGPLDRIVSVDGLRLHYLEWGNATAPTMLLFHGGSAHGHTWDMVAPAFGGRYHVLAPDHRGHGDSEWALDGNYQRTAYVGDLRALVVAEKLAPLVLVGHSAGANTSLTYAGLYPQDVTALVMVDSGPGLADEAYERAGRVGAGNHQIQGSLETFVERVRSYSPHWPDWQVRWQVQHSVRPHPGGSWTWKGDPVLRNPERRAQRGQGQQDAEELWGYWLKLRCPTLIVRGVSSRIFPPETAERLHHRLPGARLVEVPNAGHRVPEDNPAEFVRVLSTFLSSMAG